MKKPKKRPKNGFTHTFIFHVEKKNTAPLKYSLHSLHDHFGRKLHIYLYQFKILEYLHGLHEVIKAYKAYNAYTEPAQLT